MRITVIAAGRAKGTPEGAMIEDYLKRLIATGRRIGLEDCAVLEIEDRKTGPGRKEREADLILARLPQNSVVIALDERGEEMPSRAFAQRVQSLIDGGTKDLVFIIGGADGLDPRILERAKQRFAFGRATWPHLLVRAMLVEQIYRAATILTNHPYHRD